MITYDLDFKSEREAAVKTKFKSYEQLKEEIGQLNLNMQTDAEMLSNLIKHYNSTDNKLEKLKLLEDFEYMVHQYDNGLLLCDLGAFDMLLNELNMTTDSDISRQLILVLGSAVQR
jgi:nucleotide exchange factor SIL1